MVAFRENPNSKIAKVSSSLIPWTVTSWSSTKLNSYTDYIFHVKAGNAKGFGPSVIIHKRTEGTLIYVEACSYMRAGLGYETSVFNKQDDPKTSLSNKSSNRIPSSTMITRCLSGSNLSMRTVNEYRRHKRSVRSTHDQDNLSTVQSQTATPGKLGKFTFKMGFSLFGYYLAFTLVVNR